MSTLSQLSVIGGGSWATALVKIFSESGVNIKWFLRSPESVAHIKKEGRNPNYLTFLPLRTKQVVPTADIEEVVGYSDHVLFAVPSAFLESTVADIAPETMADKNVLLSVKGMVPGNGMIPSAFLGKAFDVPHSRQFIIGGPCHAEEVALERKTFMTIAGEDAAAVRQLAGSVQLDYIKAVPNGDPVGVELAAIIKNVVGIACGIARGLNYGDNFQAVLVANALHEVQGFLQAMDGKVRNLNSSGYFGDLLVTAYSEFSRNRTFGQMIGRGFTVDLAQTEMKMVAEGYYAVEGIYRMARTLNQDMPIVSMVYRILYNKISPYVEFKLLEQVLV